VEYEQLREHFRLFGQEHVLQFWPELSSDQQRDLLNQIQTIDLDLIAQLTEKNILYLRKGLTRHDDLKPIAIIPIPRTAQQQHAADQARVAGEELLRSGKVGIILVAGGQGTRLGFSGAKGLFPITPVKKKTLFQLHAEKILALSHRYQVTLPWYIMTSEINDDEIRDYFAANRYFGLTPDGVFFFQQQMMPAVSPQGKLFLASKHRVFTNPNGHGGTLSALRQSGALADMTQRGIEELFYFQVDNVLLRICDPIFIGYHRQAKAEMSSKVVIKRDPYEKIGVIGYLDDKLTVIEYSDLSEKQMNVRAAGGTLKYGAGSIAIHLLQRDFITQLTTGNFSLPYHLAHKNIPYLDAVGNLIQPAHPNGYKFEMFIFDALQYTIHSVVMEIERAEEFSPVKNANGEDSPASAEQDLCNLYGRWLTAAGITVPRNSQTGNVSGKLEISPLFALDQEEFVAKAKAGLEFQDSLYLE